MKNDNFYKLFCLRSAVCFFLTVSLFLFSILRVSVISANGEDGENNCKQRINITKIRGGIYDCNMLPLTNCDTKTVCAALPTAAAKRALKGNTDAKSCEKLENGEVSVCVSDKWIECDGAFCLSLPKRNQSLANHLLGYINGEGKGVCGLEAAYNDILSGNTVYAEIEIDGKGNPLMGSEPVIKENADGKNGYIVTTIDTNIQKIAENAGETVNSGAIVIADSKTNKIRALASFPDFSVEDIKGSINRENSPLLNKALCGYNVGSVFKPCVAAAAIESGLSDILNNCTGKMQIEGRYFKCHNHDGHKTVDLKTALRESCNCYFYNLGLITEKKNLYTYAKKMNFGTSIKIAENIYTAKGVIPKESELDTDSSVANFSIGQGSVTLSPISLLTLYGAIANGGEYYLPSVIEKTVCGGESEKYDIGAPTRAMKSETARILKEALLEVVEEGTGKAAKSEKITAAGKTATAQTGKTDQNGKEMVNSWFCGFFPFDNPLYTVIILTDNTGEKTASQIFKEISEEISKLNNLFD